MILKKIFFVKFRLTAPVLAKKMKKLTKEAYWLDCTADLTTLCQDTAMIDLLSSLVCPSQPGITPYSALLALNQRQLQNNLELGMDRIVNLLKIRPMF